MLQLMNHSFDITYLSFIYPSLPTPYYLAYYPLQGRGYRNYIGEGVGLLSYKVALPWLDQASVSDHTIVSDVEHRPATLATISVFKFLSQPIVF